MFKIFKFIFPIRDWLYLLQLEEYEHSRYLKHIPRRFLKFNFEQRGQLRFTARIKVIAGFCSVLLLGLAVGLMGFSSWLFLGLFITLPALTPFLVLAASWLAVPIAKILTYLRISKARQFFYAHYPNTKTIAITGSYGKTTTKYLLQALLEHTYQSTLLPGNINTTLGIADYILAGKIPKTTEYLIVEIGAYVKGDIYLCTTMLPPDISMITKLGDQHLERFGSLPKLYAAKYEIFTGTKAAGVCYTTESAKSLLEQNNLLSRSVVTVEDTNSPKDNELLAVKVARDLGVREDFIEDTLSKFKLPERRNQVYASHGVTVIDNSYNISPQTAQAILQNAGELASKEQKKLVVMTAGIAEQGKNSEVVNKQFAKLINETASRAILHPSIYAPYLTSELTIPYTIEPTAVPILEDLNQHLDGQSEILLLLPEHTDLAY